MFAKGSRGIFLTMNQNNGTDQLQDYSVADLYFYLTLCQKKVFSKCYMYSNLKEEISL